MLDLQAVYIRNVVELSSIDLTIMLRIVDVDPSNFTGVSVNGLSAPYMLVGGELFVGLPEGLSFAEVRDIRIKRKVTDGDGTVFNIGETVDVVSGQLEGDVEGRTFVESFRFNGKSQPTEEPNFSASSAKVVDYINILKITGDQLSGLVDVRVNGKSMPFTLTGPGSALVQFPENAASIESVEAIATTSVLNRTSFFSYLLGQNPKQVSGPFKALSQFLKVLMTTPGSDVFNKDLGGNLQNWVGGKNSLDNPQALVTKTVLSIVNTGAKFSAQQLLSGVPSDERISRVQVLGVNFDVNDPTKMSVSLKLVTADQDKILFGLGLDSMDSLIESAGSAVTG
ncbi:MAG: hypothetical protein CMA70_04535 [Euryarchaeota archaeon]|nr:hypothetical protein [Euryarchaeota archaeon]